MRISDWSSDVCSSDLRCRAGCGSARCAEVQSRRLQSSNVGRQECWQAPPASASDARVGECAPRHRDEPGTCAFPLDGWRCRRRAAELQREIGRAHAELQSLMRISNAAFCLTNTTTPPHYLNH